MAGKFGFYFRGYFTLIAGVKSSSISAPAQEPEEVQEEFITSEIQEWVEEYPLEETFSDSDEENLPAEEENPVHKEEKNTPE